MPRKTDAKAPEGGVDSTAGGVGNQRGTRGKKKREDKWQFSEAKKILKKALAKGEDENGNKVLLDSKLGAGNKQMPRNIYKLFKDHPEFQKSDFNNYNKFRDRLNRLRKAVTVRKNKASKDCLALENSLKIHPIPDKRLFVDVALPSLRIDMDAGKHLTMTPKQLRNTRPEYQEFELDKFRKHIHQEVYTRKACIQYKWKKSPNIGEQHQPEIFTVDSLEEEEEEMNKKQKDDVDDSDDEDEDNDE
jgi:hypothetical protein